MENSQYIIRPEFRARKDNEKKNMILDFSKDFVNTISNMVFADKSILTFMVVAFFVYISVALMTMFFTF